MCCYGRRRARRDAVGFSLFTRRRCNGRRRAERAGVTPRIARSAQATPRGVPCVVSRFCLEQTATGGHLGRGSFLPSIVGCDGGRVCSSTATSRTAFFGPSSADCPVMFYCPMERLAAPVTE